jgi:hypothetical protein
MIRHPCRSVVFVFRHDLIVGAADVYPAVRLDRARTVFKELAYALA